MIPLTNEENIGRKVLAPQLAKLMQPAAWCVMSVVALCCAMWLTACSGSKPAASDEIQVLDSLLDHHADLEKAKLATLADLEKKWKNATTLTDRYLMNAMLYEEYITYQADSAMKYANMNLQIATQVGNRHWLIESQLNKAQLLTATGLLSESEALMRSIDRQSLPSDLLTDYYGQMIFLYSHMGNYAGGKTNDFYAKERTYKDSIMQVIDKSHPEYLWYKGWDILGTKQPCDQIIKALVGKLQHSSYDQRQDAKDAFILAKLYEWTGDNDNYKKYMALSAIADVRIVNAEISSLEDLANIMFEQNDIDRAYSYITYSLNKAIAYPNRVKAFGINVKLDNISNAYQDKTHRQQQRISMFLALVCALTLILIIAAATIIAQNMKLKRQEQVLDEANTKLSRRNTELNEAQQQLHTANDQLKNLNERLLQQNEELNQANTSLSGNYTEASEARKQLDAANAQLTDLNMSLQRKNEELNEANYVKEQYILYAFTICSSYIDKIEDLKRNIHRKAVTRKFKEIEADTADLDMRDELKAFYRSFDTVFLHIYPNFVSDFNSLLHDDKKVMPKEGELLNTVLRIYALVRLGITDSVKIAEFLHCSVQTVYNNRFRIRNKAAKSQAEFDRTVTTLGKSALEAEN